MRSRITSAITIRGVCAKRATIGTSKVARDITKKSVISAVNILMTESKKGRFVRRAGRRLPMRISVTASDATKGIPMAVDLPTWLALGVLTLTSYQPIPEQTDSTPNITSIGHQVHPFGAAVSRDLLATDQACYGDVLYIDGYGLRVINDTMGTHTYRTKPSTPQLKWVDILVMNRAEESLVNIQKRRVWVIKSPVRACSPNIAMQMGLLNMQKVRRILNEFKTQHGRQPTHDEFRNLWLGVSK